MNVLYTMKRAVQDSIFEEMKLCQLFRLCILISAVTEYLVENCKNQTQSKTVGFFVRDFVHFFCNIIREDCSDEAKIAIGKITSM